MMNIFAGVVKCQISCETEEHDGYHGADVESTHGGFKGKKGTKGTNGGVGHGVQ